MFSLLAQFPDADIEDWSHAFQLSTFNFNELRVCCGLRLCTAVENLELQTFRTHNWRFFVRQARPLVRVVGVHF